MAVRKLAGPFDIKSTLVEGVQWYRNFVWYENVGLLTDIWMPGAMPFRGLMTLDGIVEPLSLTQYTPLGWWTRGRRPLGIVNEFDASATYEYEIEPKAFVASKIETFHIQPSGWWLPQYVKLLDGRRLLAGVSVLQSWTPSTGFVNEIIDFPFSVYSVWAGKSDVEIFCSGDAAGHSQACFYNVSTKKLSQIIHLPQLMIALAYAVEHKVLVALHNGPEEGFRQVSIYSLEVEPAEVTDPVIIKGQAKGGYVVTYQTQALGSFGEPCPNEFIDWTLSGEGRLLDIQDKTDEDGYATTKVLYGLHESGDSTIKASLRC